MKIATAQTVAAIERLARADRRHAATVEQWDADPWLLNTPGGAVDLRTGDLLRHESGRYLTKITGASPATIARYGGPSLIELPMAIMNCKRSCSVLSDIA